jgi:hypothetical protein
MRRWGHVEDLPQAEGYETPKVGRSKQGTKTHKNNRKKEKKTRENKKNQRK